MAPREQWLEAFGSAHLALGRGWTIRARRWRGVLHLVARPAAVRWHAGFHVTDDGPRGLVLRRVVFAGDMRRPQSTRPGRAARLCVRFPRFAVGPMVPDAWYASPVPMLSWGRADVPAADVWDALRFLFGSADRNARSRVWGPLRNYIGRQVRGSDRLNAPPAGTVLPRVCWQPTANRRTRQRLNGAERAANARLRESRSAAWDDRSSGYAVH